ncbi:unnamed protein product [Ectocarpus sp. 6 AP-2014]
MMARCTSLSKGVMRESPRTSLLLSGADASLRDSTRVSPIDLAVDQSQDEIVVALAQKGVDLEGADEPPLEMRWVIITFPL